MENLSTYEIFYGDKSVVRVFSTDREAIAWFDETYPGERWTYLKDVVSGLTLGHDDYDRIMKFEAEETPRRKAMAEGLRWPAHQVVTPPPIDRVLKEPTQGSLFQ